MAGQRRALTGLVFCLLAVIAGCGKETGDAGVRQTHFPGQISAGGGSSGEVMAQAKQKTAEANPSGTPGIPEGAGGTTSGAAMGGASPGAAASQKEAGGAKTAEEAGRGTMGPATSAPGTPQTAGSATTSGAPAAPEKK